MQKSVKAEVNVFLFIMALLLWRLGNNIAWPPVNCNRNIERKHRLKDYNIEIPEKLEQIEQVLRFLRSQQLIIVIINNFEKLWKSISSWNLKESIYTVF